MERGKEYSSSRGTTPSPIAATPPSPVAPSAAASVSPSFLPSFFPPSCAECRRSQRRNSQSQQQRFFLLTNPPLCAQRRRRTIGIGRQLATISSPAKQTEERDPVQKREEKFKTPDHNREGFFLLLYGRFKNLCYYKIYRSIHTYIVEEKGATWNGQKTRPSLVGWTPGLMPPPP